jgi:hypothetical protein
VYDIGKTPMQNTPSYYPSAHQQWGAINSPAYVGGTDYDYGHGGTSPGPNFSRPGSEYHNSRPGTPRNDNWVKSENERV